MHSESYIIILKLEEIISILKRIEDRQVVVKAELEDKPIGWSSQLPPEHERTGH